MRGMGISGPALPGRIGASALAVILFALAGTVSAQQPVSESAPVGTGDWYWNRSPAGSGPTPLAPERRRPDSIGTVTAEPLPPATSPSALTPEPLPDRSPMRPADVYERGYRQGRLDAIRELDLGIVRPSAPPPVVGSYAPPPGPVVTTSAESSWVMADWARIQADWPSARYDILRRWPRLTAADLDRIGGDRNELLARIQDRYAISNERADEQVAAWQRGRAS